MIEAEHIWFSQTCDQEKKASIERFKRESTRIKKIIFLEIASGACSWYRLSENRFENQSSRSQLHSSLDLHFQSSNST